MTVSSIREYKMSLDSLIKKAIAKQPTIKPVLKKRNAQPEAIAQAAVVSWARANERNYPFLWMLHSSLNGLKRTKEARRKATASGMLSGVPDLFLPVPISDKKGLYIEMKSKTGRISIEQSKYLKAVSDFGYAAFICYSAVEAIDKIKAYYNPSI
jgi:VRR-NUC domain